MDAEDRDRDGQIPPLAGSGAYKIVVKAEDMVAKTTAELSVPFEVRGQDVAPSDTLVVRNFRFYAREKATEPWKSPPTGPAKAVWARFDIIGYKYGPGNAIDVSYSHLHPGRPRQSAVDPEGARRGTERILLSQALCRRILGHRAGGRKAGRYTLVVPVKDAIGGQTCESRQTFTVQ